MLELVGEEHIEKLVELADGVDVHIGFPLGGLAKLAIDASGQKRFLALGEGSAQGGETVS